MGRAGEIAAERGVGLLWEVIHQTGAVICDGPFSLLLAKAVRRHQPEAPLLTSGAGHDAAALAAICPVAMLFVRCKGGLSHHPDESVESSDVRVAMEVLAEFLKQLAERSEET